MNIQNRPTTTFQCYCVCRNKVLELLVKHPPPKKKKRRPTKSLKPEEDEGKITEINI